MAQLSRSWRPTERLVGERQAASCQVARPSTGGQEMMSRMTAGCGSLGPASGQASVKCMYHMCGGCGRVGDGRREDSEHGGLRAMSPPPTRTWPRDGPRCRMRGAHCAWRRAWPHTWRMLALPYQAEHGPQICGRLSCRLGHSHSEFMYTSSVHPSRRAFPSDKKTRLPCAKSGWHGR